ncbi:hypothetical protein V491_06606 [Pseudogymnoascus sp. VKM F-3775]|nr:hypothetical protein V491_06606 [Pseudogymnoascus sp. VKM F-3775]
MSSLSLGKHLAKSKIESQNTSMSPWSAETWQAAHNAFASGTDRPPPRFPIVISEDSLISTAEKLQHLASLPTLPEIEITRTAPRLWEDLDAPPADDRKVHATDGEPITVWFRGTRREAWVAESLKRVTQNVNIRDEAEGNCEGIQGESTSPWSPEVYRGAAGAYLSGTDKPPLRFPIIISKDGLFPTAEKLQQFANIPMLPDMRTTKIVSISRTNEDGPPVDGKEVQICDVDCNQKFKIEGTTKGEILYVWFMGETRAAWLARSLGQSSIDAGF